MSVGRLGKVTNWPDDVHGQKVLDERQAQWGEIPGRIVAFDAAKQTATVQPLYKPRHNGKAIDMPELYDVPVRMVRAGKGGLTFPVGEGDYVTLRPQMRSTENYHDKGDGEASDARSFALADMEAHLDGGESLTNPIRNFDSANVHMRFDEDGQYGIRGSKEGKFKIDGSEGNLYEILAEFMELVASDQLMINYGSSAGTGHRLFNRSKLMELAAKVRGMAL
jgi:hypothetical protein